MELKKYFADRNLFDGSREFFANELAIKLTVKTGAPLDKSQFISRQPLLPLVDKLYFAGGISDDSFTMFGENRSAQELAADDKYKGLFVFCLDLASQPTRTALAELTRALNRSAKGAPVVTLFRWGENLSLAACERMPYEQQWREGEKAGKVSLLKDIYLPQVHSGHERILRDMRIPATVSSFDALHEHWRKVFSVSLLNKKFYEELFNWYLWAVRTVEFPKPKHETLDDKSYASVSVIRLLTRLIFIWFVKEKKLIPPELFDQRALAALLKNFQPASDKSNQYYTAVLQNLFFATLNTPMDRDALREDEKRRFIDDKKGFSDDHMNHLVYRHADAFSDSSGALRIFSAIPFLNGGLFECLDSRETDAKGKIHEIRYDGFSSDMKKCPRVPNVLFFGSERRIDLSDEFDGDSKRKQSPVRGLIEILASYKFTITENTPLEEEIALDPELLGKVFENLLASYNPETKTTARKQTGSFYTPREIVNYMVDESLKAYLLQKLLDRPAGYAELGKAQTDMFGNKARKGQMKMETAVLPAPTGRGAGGEEEERLNRLFSYTATENPFTETETDLLIDALSNCKILDPACGSGAFPMGILHRMVHLLGKLDPKNLRWKQAQLKKAEADLKRAEAMADMEIRDKSVESARERIRFIRESFDNPYHELDYTRKLFLIEDCIYGVDIQQIAVQIAKLRFFISLIAEQRVDDGKPNRNILSMPNLETKFVAANTLISLEKNISAKKGQAASGFFESADVKKIERELKEIRQRIFFTRRYRDKKKLKAEERQKRAELKAALLHSGFGEKSATQAADWDPFDPMHSAPFFDTETMFELPSKNGEGVFDIVIGNPPYGIDFEEEIKEYLKRKYEYLVQRIRNSYLYFIGVANDLVRPGGVFSYIVPNEFLFQIYMEKARTYFLTNAEFKIAVNAGEDVFEAIVPSCVILIQKKKAKDYSISLKDLRGKELQELSRELVTENFISIPSAQLLETPNAIFFFNQSNSKLISSILKKSKQFEEYCEDVANGISTSCDGVYIVKAEFAKEKKLEKKYLKPSIRGTHFNQFFCPEKTGEYVLYVTPDFDKSEAPNIYSYLKENKSLLIQKSVEKKTGIREWHILFRQRDETLFISPKIIIRQTGDRIIAAIDEDKNYYCIDSVNIARIKTEHLSRMKFLIGILNSQLSKFIYREISQEGGRVLAQVKPQRIKQMPIIETPYQRLFEKIVSIIESKKKQGQNGNYYERQLDLMVYKLYGLSWQEVLTVEGAPENAKDFTNTRGATLTGQTYESLPDVEAVVRWWEG